MNGELVLLNSTIKKLIIYLGTPLLHKLKRIDLCSKQSVQIESL